MDRNIKQVLHMMGGAGENSYAANSRLQERAILQTRSVMEEVIEELCNTIAAETLVVADLGCSCGPNAFRVISQVVASVEGHCIRSGLRPPEIQFFLNDLPGNDFNSLFHYLSLEGKRARDVKAGEDVPLYFMGLPGSFYERLFPQRSVHFFHTSYSLMWLSQVPRGLEDLESNIYLTEESSPRSWKMYLEQYKSDFSRFLKLRLLSDALRDMVDEGLVQGDILNACKFPQYAPLMEEVTTIVKMEGSFCIEEAHTFESTWDPLDESNEDVVLDEVSSGKNVAACIRAVAEPLLSSHFGEASPLNITAD
ncbi:hypothetical protein HPP92_017851 [Vanilla planifolia]|uniref:Uncharacterized protein n=1 Tax=Vanilla planifolia TaxID=51239 RepID=A0A835UNW0_VANPL|nr:hypothetical protein HPP92_017851 [Vanilla planifolia]